MLLNSESAEIHIKMHEAAAYYWQTPQTSQIKQSNINKRTTTIGSFENPERRIRFRSFRILKHFYMYSKAQQFKLVNDSRVPDTALTWLPGLTQM